MQNQERPYKLNVHLPETDLFPIQYTYHRPKRFNEHAVHKTRDEQLFGMI